MESQSSNDVPCLSIVRDEPIAIKIVLIINLTYIFKNCLLHSNAISYDLTYTLYNKIDSRIFTYHFNKMRLN